MAALRWIPLDELPKLEALISEEIQAGTRTRRRDALAVALGLHGMRVGEVARADWGDLYAAGCRLHVPEFKRGRARDVELHASLVERLASWRGDREPGPLLFTSKRSHVHPSQFRRAARRLIEAAIGLPLKFHCLRHTFAMRLYEASRDLFLVQQKLGHRSVKSTEVYAASLAQVPDAVLLKLDAGPPAHQLKLFQGA